MRFTRYATALLMPAAVALLYGCQAEPQKTAAPEIPGAKVEFPSANQPIPTTYFTTEHIGAVILHPKRVINSKLSKNLFEVLEQKKPGAVDKFFQQFADKAGFDLRELEQVVVLLDKQSASNPSKLFSDFAALRAGRKKRKAKEDNNDDGVRPAVILRMAKPVDPKAVLEKLKTLGADKDDGKPDDTITSKDYNGKTVYFDSGIDMSFCFVDATTIIGADEAMVKKMIDAKPVDTPLTKLMAKIGMEHDVISVFAEGPEHDKSTQLIREKIPTQMIPPEYREFIDYLGKAKATYYTFSITSSPLFAIGLTMEDEATAKKLAGDINGKLLTKLRQEYQKKRQPEMQGGQTFDELVNGIAAGTKGRDVVLSIKRPAELDDLPKMIAPWIR